MLPLGVKFTGGEPSLNMAIITRGHSAKLLSNSSRASFRRSTRAARVSPPPHDIKRKSQATRDLRKEAVRLARKETKDYFYKIAHDEYEQHGALLVEAKHR